MFNFDFLEFQNVPCKSITLENIEDFIADNDTKRINFAHSHATALKRGNGDVVGWFNLKFDQPFECIACSELGINKLLFKGGLGYNRCIKDKGLYAKLEQLIEKYKDLVFLRDCLDLSVALSMHESEPGKRTTLGEHEFKVKYRSDTEDVSANKSALINELQDKLKQLPFFKLADYICCIPSKRPFMKELVSELQGFSFIDISDKIFWKEKSGSLKNVDTPIDKLRMIISWGFTIEADLDLKNKTVLLVDDMYKSGVTMQYVAMKLKEAGAKRVFGITLVKALGNN